MHLAEVGLEIDLIHAHFALLDVAGFKAHHWFLIGAEDVFRGNRERLLCQADHSGRGVRVRSFVGEFLIELERLLELAEFFLQQFPALEHGRAGLGAFRIFADQLRPFFDGHAIAGGDLIIRRFCLLGIECLGFVCGTKQIEDPGRAFVQRVGAQEFVEPLHGELLLFSRQRVESHLEFRVDDGVLAIRPLGAVWIVLNVSLPSGDGFSVFLLLVLDFSDPIESSHF